MNAIHDGILAANDKLTWLLIVMLAAAGLLFTLWSKGAQFRRFGTMVKVAIGSRSGGGEGISSFQAFCISLASRVGTGNIVGVAIALALGGPGAIFWMWVMAFLGMATAFVEATLAQLYKVPHTDGTFRGGPAYYMQRGLKSRPMGIAFAICLIFTFGLAFNMVQANTIAGVVEGTWGIPTWITAIVLVVITAAIVLGGLKSVARVTEYMAPLMALAYFLLALTVLVLRIGEVPDAIGEIFKGAFGLDQALAGTAGGIVAAMLNGVKRGMFSNEAGMGSAPNAAAAATTSHPAHQGMVQALGVFIDTIIVCTSTAVMILLAGPEVYTPGVTTRDQAATLTQTALASELGSWVAPVMAFLIFVFAFSSVIGNETYAEVNMDFMRGGKVGAFAIRLLTIGAVAWGALQSLAFVWDLADLAMTFMAVLNLVALMALGKHAIAALRDLESNPDPVNAGFDLDDNPYMPDDVPGEVWRRRPGHAPGQWFAPDQEHGKIHEDADV